MAQSRGVGRIIDPPCLLSLLLMLGPIAPAHAAPVSTSVRLYPGEGQALFVKDGPIMTPLAVVNGGRIEAFEGSAREYFAAGRAYYLYSAGSVGKALASGEKDVGCGTRAGIVKAVEGPDANGVLSNFPLGPQRAAARAPTGDERKLIKLMAKQQLRRQGIPPYYIARMLDSESHGVQRRQSLAVLQLPDNPEPRLFASYALDWSLDKRRGSIALSFIAEPNKAGTYLIGWQDFDQTEGESSGSTRTFLASADLDGDSSDELVLAATGNEKWWYEVLSRVRGKWTLIATSPAGGC